MSRNIMTPFRVGIVAIAGVIAFAFMIGQVTRDTDRRSGYTVFAILDDVSGLVPHSRVRIAGIEVGSIESVELVGKRAKVVIRVRVPLYTDAAMVRRQGSLLGDHFIQLLPGLEEPLLGEGDEITNVITETGPAAIISSLETVSADISEVTSSVKNVLGGEKGQEALASIVDSLASATVAFSVAIEDNAERFDRIFANIDAITSDIRMVTGGSGQSVNEILAQLQVIMTDVSELVGKSKVGMDDTFGSFQGTMGSLHTALDEANESLVALTSISRKIDSGEGTVGGLLNERKLLSDTERLVEDAGNLLGSVSRMQTIVGLRTELNVVQNSLRNYFSLRLQPRMDKYYLLEILDDPRGDTEVVRRTTRTTDPNFPPFVSEEITETRDRLKFSLQYAKRYHFLTGRFGIIEGTGGVGANADFFGDRLQVRADLFSFGADLNPRLKWFFSYNFMKHFHLLGGMDDLFNRHTRDYFFGGGLSFTDDDLRGLLMLIKPSGG